MLLRDAMVDAPYDPGDMVFEQGDEGDSFYVVLEGEFEVLITQTEGEEEGKETVVATVGEGGFFGERALLENKPRAASIRCKESSRTMAITRNQFEMALGAPLKELLPRLQEGRTFSSGSSGCQRYRGDSGGHQ